MSKNTWMETLVTQQAAGTAFGSFTTAKTVIPAQCLYTLPPGYFEIGKALEIDVWGELGNVSSAQNTWTFQVMIASVVAFTTGAFTSSTTPHVALPFHLRIGLTCRSVGASTSATLAGQSLMTCRNFVVSGATADINTNGMAALTGPATTPAVGTGFDSTISNILDFFVASGASHAENIVRINQYTVKSLN